MWIFIKQFYVRSTFPPFLGRDRESGDWTAWWGKPGKGPRGEWEAVSWWSWFINICSDVLSGGSAVLLAPTFRNHGYLMSRPGRRRRSIRSRRKLHSGSWAMGVGRRHVFFFFFFFLTELLQWSQLGFWLFSTDGARGKVTRDPLALRNAWFTAKMKLNW